MAAPRIAAPLFLLLLLCYTWPFDLEPGANVWAHIDQAAAIVTHRTLAIDAFMSPPDGPNTVDWSRAIDFEKLLRLGAGLLAVSIANHLLITLVVITVDDDVRNPLAAVIYPLAWRGDLQRSNLAVFFLGIKGRWSLAPLVILAAGATLVLAHRLRTNPTATVSLASRTDY